MMRMAAIDDGLALARPGALQVGNGSCAHATAMAAARNANAKTKCLIAFLLRSGSIEPAFAVGSATLNVTEGGVRNKAMRDAPLFTGYTRDGGYATHALADAGYCFPLPERGDDAEIAPLMCAGMIGWRSYRNG